MRGSTVEGQNGWSQCVLYSRIASHILTRDVAHELVHGGGGFRVQENRRDVIFNMCLQLPCTVAECSQRYLQRLTTMLMLYRTVEPREITTRERLFLDYSETSEKGHYEKRMTSLQRTNGLS